MTTTTIEDTCTSSEEVCSLSKHILLEKGFINPNVFPYLGYSRGASSRYLVLFNGLTPENYVYGKDSCLDFEAVGDRLFLHNVWVKPPLESRIGIGKKLVNTCLVEIARKLRKKEIGTYSLHTEVAENFWRNLEGWRNEGENLFSREVVQ